MKNLVILISGTGTNMLNVIRACKDGRINASVRAVISSNCSALGLERAIDEGIETYVCALSDFESGQKRDMEIKRIALACKADYIVLAGYLGIFTDVLLDCFSRRIINIHPSLLPKFGGKGCFGINVHRKVIESGDKISGATVHFVDKNIDTGEIIAQKSIKVLDNDTAESLQKRILEQIEPHLLIEVLQKLCN